VKRRTSFVGPGIVATLLLMVGATWIAAQARSDPSMVYVRVAAITREGRYVSGLPKDGFKIFEDNVPRDVAYFSAEDSSSTIAILIDADAQTRDQVGREVIGELKRGQISRDEIYLVESSAKPLNNAVYEALNELLQRPGEKRALILVTTSTTPESRSFSRVKEFLKRQDVQLFVIAIPAPNTTATQANPLLKELAEVSGGTAFFPVSMRPMPQIYHLIATDLRNQYLLGYHPKNQPPDGKWRKIKVNAQLTKPNGKAQTYAVKTRAGYYAVR
jgi:Ca-activated chloride channel homolog